MISVLQENLNKSLVAVGRVIAKNPVLPILRTVLCNHGDGVLTLRGTDLTTTITETVPVKGNDAAQFCANWDDLRKLVATLPKLGVVELEADGRNLRVSCGRVKARLPILAASEYPAYREAPEDAVAVILDPMMLRLGLRRVLDAAGADEYRPILTGVNLRFRGGLLALACTDGVRLHVQSVATEKGEYEGEVNVPAESAKEWLRALGTEPVTLLLSPVAVYLRTGNAEIQSVRIAGSFPNYGQLIPLVSGNIVTLASESLIDAAKTAAVVDASILRLTLEDGAMRVTAREAEDGDVDVWLDVTVTGEPSKIALNGKYLLEALEAMGGGQATMQTSSPSAAAVLRRVDDDGYVAVLMPMFMQWE